MPIVTEFARLTLDPTPGSLDQATIPPSAFQWLVEHARGGPLTPGIVSLEGPRSLRVLNYVGVLETPAAHALKSSLSIRRPTKASKMPAACW